MKLEIFTLCDYAQDFQGKLAIMGTFDTIKAKSFPAIHPQCSVAVRLRLKKEEGENHEFKIDLMKVSKNELTFSSKGNFNIGFPIDKDSACANIALNIINLNLNEGDYAFILYIDNKEIDKIPLYTIKI